MPDPSLNPFIIESRHPARSAPSPGAADIAAKELGLSLIWTGVILVAAVRLRWGFVPSY